MQALTAPPRDGFTDDQILTLLQAAALEVDLGCELLDANLNVVDDISGDVIAAGGTVEWDSTSSTGSVSRDLSIGMARALNWGTDLVRPYMLLAAGGIQARFNVGVFCLTTPQDTVGSSPMIFQVTGFDRLYLLSREVGDSRGVGAGSNYIDAILDTISAAGLTGVDIDQSAAAAVLPADMTWPQVSVNSDAATQWLDIINALLSAIGYDPLWCDENGIYRSQPHVDVSARPAEFTLDADDAVRTIVGAQRTRVQDQWAAPNMWIFIQSGFSGTPTEGDGIYTVTNQSDGPASIDQRGLVWPKTFTLDAADQPTLMQLGDAQVAADMADLLTLTIPTGPLPIAGQADVIALVDSAAGGSFMVQATAWSLPLDGQQMSWTVQAA